MRTGPIGMRWRYVRCLGARPSAQDGRGRADRGAGVDGPRARAKAVRRPGATRALGGRQAGGAGVRRPRGDRARSMRRPGRRGVDGSETHDHPWRPVCSFSRYRTRAVSTVGRERACAGAWFRVPGPPSVGEQTPLQRRTTTGDHGRAPLNPRTHRAAGHRPVHRRQDRGGHGGDSARPSGPRTGPGPLLDEASARRPVPDPYRALSLTRPPAFFRRALRLSALPDRWRPRRRGSSPAAGTPCRGHRPTAGCPPFLQSHVRVRARTRGTTPPPR